MATVVMILPGLALATFAVGVIVFITTKTL